MLAIIRYFKIHNIILIIALCFFSTSLYCKNIQQQILECSNKLIDNKVQIKLIETYIDNLKNRYKNKLISLNNKQKEFSTSVTMLYKLKVHPKETILLKKLTSKDTLITAILTEHLIKNATNSIQKINSELDEIQNTTEELTKSKTKLVNLNQELIKIQKKLNNLASKSQIDESNLIEINYIRSLLKYNTTLAAKNSEIFNKINQPTLTKFEKELDEKFITENKGKMGLPSKGYIHSNYQNSKYYSLTYYGIVYIAGATTDITTPAEGEVIFCDTLEKYNNVVIIKHSPSFISIISGDFLVNVKLSQKVKKNELLGKTKNYTTPIYFELNHKSTPINPHPWLINTNLGEP